MRNLLADDRGLAVGLMVFVLILLVGAFYIIFLTEPVTTIGNNMNNSTTSTTAASIIDERQHIWGFVGFFVLFCGMVFLIARGVREGRP